LGKADSQGMSVTSIALSGLLAQTQRLARSASNVANVRTTGARPDAGGKVPDGAPEAYQPVDTVQQSVVGPDGQGLGTSATYQPRRPATVAEYSPDSSVADDQGLVAAPNVDLAAEAVDQTVALRTYQANLKAFEAADEMTREALNLTT
jgi:flagellar basal-body rod protein FlgC